MKNDWLSTDCYAWRNPRLAGRIPELDGVRGLAILLVLVWHYIVGDVYALRPLWQARAVILLSLTWSGVDLFFVLSGFLIGGILLDAKYAHSYYRTFYFRRFHRILPLYLVWLLIFLLGVYVTGPRSAEPLRHLFNRRLPLWSYPLFFQNFFMVSRGTFGAVWMGVTWSLAVEEQFYLLLPLAIRRLSLKGIIRLIFGAILLAPALRTLLWFVGRMYSGSEISYFGPYTLLLCRADALGLGVLAAIACRNQKAWIWLVSHRKYGYWALLALGSGLPLLTLHPQGRLMATVGYSWLALFYVSLLLLVVAKPGHAEQRLFRSLVLVRLGTVAYAVYMFHEGINALYHYAILGERPGTYDLRSLGVTFLSLVTVLALAAISWRVLEKPLIRRGHSRYRYATNAQEAIAASADNRKDEA